MQKKQNRKTYDMAIQRVSLLLVLKKIVKVKDTRYSNEEFLDWLLRTKRLKQLRYADGELFIRAVL